VRAHQARNVTERAVDHGWRHLDENDSHTLARLAATSIGHGDPNLREASLDILRNHPGHYVRMCLTRLGQFVWFDPTNPRALVLAYRISYIVLLAFTIDGQ
jgi:hypothetical protein